MTESTRNFNFAMAENAEYLERLYQVFQENPQALSAEMQAFFEGLNFAARIDGTSEAILQSEQRQSRVDSLVYNYRDCGHRVANLDPLGNNPASFPPLELSDYELDESDLDRQFDSDHFGGIDQPVQLRELLSALRETYCGPIGVQYMHIEEKEERRWLQSRLERGHNQPRLKKTEHFELLGKLNEAELFESFLHANFLGQKRFSLEGAESLIPTMDCIIDQAAADGCVEIVIGMSHRGRLNVLANVLKMPKSMIFAEFEENFIPGSIYGDGDVKYHQGFSADLVCPGGPIHVSLAANPSHLEMIGPVVLGKTRAKQAYRRDLQRKKIIPLILHGDAAFAGQGVVAECFQMSQLAGYRTGGAIHIIINNQIGFTTLPKDYRSSLYSSDVAKMIGAPVFHVNGDYPDCLAHVARIAFDYRQKFSKDVVIDLVCFRRHGHNEGDNPDFTQPMMYEKIKDHPRASEVYKRRLVEQYQFSAKEVERRNDASIGEINAALNEALEISRHSVQIDLKGSLAGKWSGVEADYRHEEQIDTGVPESWLEEIARCLIDFPEDFTPHPTVRRIFEQRFETIRDKGSIDWAFAETLAFGALMKEGTLVRLSGQDSVRGTFSQRHAAIYDKNTGKIHIPLRRLKVNSERPMLWVFDSPLSEAAVLAFEYGYSLADPRRLVIWEAQFGDFANGAQVIIDQFISASISKWGRYSGLVLLLPHGYEGQGPEHSSAKLERFLQLCAEDNIQVCYPTTPAQYFHLLRRQIHRKFRRALVVMAPKSILRNRNAVSPFAEFTAGRFHELLDDPQPAQNPRRLILCSGKVYYDLMEQRQELDKNITDVVRVECFYPFPKQRWQELALKYAGVEQVLWVQEEPENMGGWTFIEPKLREIFKQKILYIGRDRSASPATASLKIHQYEQSRIVAKAFDENVAPSEDVTGIAIKYA